MLRQQQGVGRLGADDALNLGIVSSQEGQFSLPKDISIGDVRFLRLGADLELVLPDGRHVLLSGFFNHDGASLLTAQGAILSADFVRALAGPLAPGQYAQQGDDPVDRIQIGVVDTVGGTASARHADGTTETLQKGSPVFQGDVLETSADGAVGLVLADRSTFSLGHGGRLVLDEMVYDPASQQGQTTVSVLRGPFGFVSGQIAHSSPGAMLVRTPVMTIAVRGTTVAGTVDDAGQTQVALLGDPGGGIGQITLSNASGSQTLTMANTLVSVASAFVAPPIPVSVSSAVLAQTFGSAMNNLPPPPPAAQGMEWSTVPGKAQPAPVQEIQTRPGAGSHLDIGHPDGTRIIAPPASEPGAKMEKPLPSDQGAKQDIPAETTARDVVPSSENHPSQAEPTHVNLLVTPIVSTTVAAVQAPTVINKAMLPVSVESIIGLEVVKSTTPTVTVVNTPVTETPKTEVVEETKQAESKTVQVDTDPVGTDTPQTSTPSPVPTVPSSQGRLVDGPIAGAVVFRDMDGDSVLDAGEYSATTASDGSFTLQGSGGTIVALPGGVDQETGLTIQVVMMASGSASVITPLTTLAATVGEARLKELLGLDPSVDLSTTDPMADTSLREMGVKLMAAVVTLKQGAAALGVNPSAGDIMGAIANSMLAQGNGGSFDLGDIGTFAQVLRDLPGVNPSDPKIITLATIAMGAAETAADIVHGAAPKGALDGIVGANITQMTNSGLTTDLSDASAIYVDLSTLRTAGLTSFTVVRGSATLTAVQASGLTFTQMGSADVMVVDSAANIAAQGSGLAGIPWVQATASGDLSALSLSQVDGLTLVGNTILTAAQLVAFAPGDVTKDNFTLSLVGVSGSQEQRDLSLADSLTLSGDVALSLSQLAEFGGGKIVTNGHGVFVGISGNVTAMDLGAANHLMLTGDATLSQAQYAALVAAGGTVQKSGHLLTVRAGGDLETLDLSMADRLVLTANTTLTPQQADLFPVSHVDNNGYPVTVPVSADVSGYDLSCADELLGSGNVGVTLSQADRLQDDGLTSVLLWPNIGSAEITINARDYSWRDGATINLSTKIAQSHITLLGGTVGLITGSQGDDLIQISGGLVMDCIDGHGGVDTISFADYSGPLLVDLQNGFALDGQTTSFILTGFQRVEGSAYADTLMYGVVSYRNATSGVTVDLVNGVAQGGIGQNDSLSYISGVVGSSYADTLIGAGGEIFYLSGDTVQNGEVIEGGAAGCALYLSGAEDLRRATLSNVTQFYLFGDGATGIVNASQLAQIAGELGYQTILDADGSAGQSWRISLDLGDGSTLGTWLQPGYNSPIYVDGSAHTTSLCINDLGMIGGTANDTVYWQSLPMTHQTFIGGAGSDTLVIGGSADLTAADVFSGFERIQFSSSTASLTATAAQLAGVVIDAANCALTVQVNDVSGLTLSNWGGDDIFIWQGSAGDDTLVGSSQNDQLRGLGGNDSLNGGAGIDYALYGDSYDTPQTINLATGTATGGAGNDTLISIEGVLAGESVRSITGDSGDNGIILTGYGSLQTLAGGAGTDTLILANSVSLGSVMMSGIESLAFTGGYNAILGKTQFDALTSITGYAGARIRVSLAVTDRVLDASAKSYSVTPSLYFDASAVSAGSTLTGGAGTDYLSAGTGNDLFKFNAGDVTGAESIIGGAGNDTIQLLGNVDFRSAILQGIEILSPNGNNATFTIGQIGLSLLGGAGNDTVTLMAANPSVGQTITAQSFLLGTSLWNSGGTDRLVINGTDYDDSITGSTVIDAIYAGGGDDWIYGGSNAGGDSLYGGDGNDVFDFALSGASLFGLINGGTGYDRIVLNGGAFFNLASNTVQEVEEIDFGYAGGVRTYSFNAASLRGTTVNLHGLAAANVSFEVKDGVLTDLSTVIFDGVAPTVVSIGYGGVNLYAERIIIGTAMADSIVGASGADTITGGLGNDTINGNGGIDVVSYAGSGSSVTVDLAAGTASGGMGTDLLTLVEGVIGSLFDDTLIGGSGVLDTVLYSNATSAVRVDLLSGTASGGAGQDTLTGFEVVGGSAFDDTLIGGVANAWLSYRAASAAVTVDVAAGTASGGAGNDVISGFSRFVGSAYDDVLLGGSGDETFVGGLGNDLINGGGGINTVDYSSFPFSNIDASLTSLVVNLGGGNGTVTASSGTDSLINIQKVIGSYGTDIMTGGAGNDTFDSGGGSDTLVGNGGDDVFILHSNSTTLASVVGGTGVDTVDLSNVGGYCYLHLYGDSSNGELYFGTASRLSGIEVVIGSKFGDALIGSLAADTIYGGDGGDAIAGCLGNDYLDGGSGSDWVCYSARSSDAVFTDVSGSYYSGSAVTVDLSLGLATGGAGSDSLVNFENIKGSIYNDTLIGDAGANIIDGGTGNDVLNGNGGTDTLTGGAGADTFLISGGASPSNRMAVITDFATGSDHMDLSNALLNLGASGALSTTTDAKQFAVSATAMGAGAVNYAGDNSANAGVILIGAPTGSADVQVWYSADIHNASTANSYQIATIQGQNTSQVANTDFHLVS